MSCDLTHICYREAPASRYTGTLFPSAGIKRAAGSPGAVKGLFAAIAGMLILNLFVHPAILSAQQADSIAQNAAALDWEKVRLDQGVWWLSYRGDDLNEARLSINVIEVWMDSTTVQVELAWVQDELQKTSDLAKDNGGFAAINGSFFDMRAGGSVVFMKHRGEVITGGNPTSGTYTENGAIAWNPNSDPLITAKPADGWQSLTHESVLTSGPLLISDSDLQSFASDPFNQNRHPRTAAAFTHDRRLLLVTVDGRSFQSYGMTIPELALFFQQMGARDALNLDGGGSTAMWIEGATENGIVSYPSDNLEFDHEGERGVSNALMLIRGN